MCANCGRRRREADRYASGLKVKLTYDSRHNVAYLRLQEKTAEVETIRVSDELNVDIAPDGTAYGIELLNANQQPKAKQSRPDG
jgi:uncharacterized protein YuzE